MPRPRAGCRLSRRFPSRSVRLFCQGVVRRRLAALLRRRAILRHGSLGSTCRRAWGNCQDQPIFQRKNGSSPIPAQYPSLGRAWLRGFADGARRIRRRQPDGISLRSPQGSRFEPSGRSPQLHPMTGWMCPLSGQIPAVPPIFHDNVLARACGRTGRSRADCLACAAFLRRDPPAG